MTTIVEGWVRVSQMRKCDVDKNPVEDWKITYGRCHGSGTNPYVYTTKAKALQCRNGMHSFHPVHDFEYAPRPSHFEQDAWREWYNNAPIIGYYEYKSFAVPARIELDIGEEQ